jgi:hypothetical protein
MSVEVGSTSQERTRKDRKNFSLSVYTRGYVHRVVDISSASGTEDPGSNPVTVYGDTIAMLFCTND